MGKTLKNWIPPSGFSSTILSVPTRVAGYDINKLDSNSLANTIDTTIEQITIGGNTNNYSGAPWGTTMDKIVWRKNPKVTQIRIVTMPSKVQYNSGEALNLSGLTVKAIYDNDTEEMLNNYTTTPANGQILTTEDTTVVITYQGKTTSFDITVVVPAVDRFTYNDGSPDVVNNPAIITTVTSRTTGVSGKSATLQTVSLPICTNISSKAFGGWIAACESLTTALFPECTSIGESAFQMCYSLTTISFPKCITIEEGAFSECNSLTAVNLPECTSISSDAFSYCMSISIFSLPKLKVLTQIGGMADVQSVYLPECTTVESCAFMAAIKLSSISLPKCVSIGDSVFMQCDQLSEIYLPNCETIGNLGLAYAGLAVDNVNISLPKCINVGEGGFNQTHIKSLSLPECITLGSNAFQWNDTLISVYLPKVSVLNTGTFDSCASLVTVSIPNVTHLCSEVFFECSSLTSLSLPKCSYIEAYAVRQCWNLQELTIGTEISHVCTVEDGFITYASLTSIYVPASLASAYKSAANWSYFADKIVPYGDVPPTPPVTKLPVGGRIYYDDGDNGATYTFYDGDDNVITDTSISGLANAVSYSIEGTPTKDRWYVYDNTSHTTGGIYINSGFAKNKICWDTNYSTHGQIGITSDGIGKGKTNTATALAFASDWGNDVIWGYIRNCNNDNLNGCNDWFIASKAEHDKLKDSGLVDWCNTEFIWSSVEYANDQGYYWYKPLGGWKNKRKDYVYSCFAARAF